MCCVLRPAKLTNTILYAAETLHAGQIVHVMGYQNRAENQVRGPNAMLLPIPSDAAMGPDNMLDTTEAKSILKDYADALRVYHAKRSRGLKMFGGAAVAGAVQVFDKGSYTVALAEDARNLPTALNRIPERKRPPVNAAIFEAYASLYPGWKMALCAWDGTIDAEPLLWWYQPKNEDQLFMPALDAHDGHPPKIGSDVAVDHTLIVGSISGPGQDGIQVAFRDKIPEHLKPFLATKIAGYEAGERHSKMKNGDFVCKVSNVHKGVIERVPPPGIA